MSEETADRLKWLLRACLVAAAFYLITSGTRGLKGPHALMFVWACNVVILMTIYLEFFLGVSVTGLARLFGVPRGKPFTGIAPGEEPRFRLNFAYGSINWAGYKGVFKLLLTNRRLLAGANLTKWFLLEIPFEQIVRAVAKKRRLIFPAALIIEQSGSDGTATCKIGVANDKKFRELLAQLGKLGVRVEESGDGQSIPS